MAHDVSEHKERLWMLVAGPTIWVVHFLLTYGTAAIWCAKVGPSLAGARVAIGVFTIIGLPLVAGIGAQGWRRHRFGGSSVPHDDDSPEDRYRFIGLATFLLAGLSAIAIVFQAMAAVFFGSCA